MIGLIDSLRSVVGPGGILTSPSELLVYECDGFTIEKNKPDVVVFPTSTEQVVQIVPRVRGIGCAVSGARGWHEPIRRLFAGGRRRGHFAFADETHP